jgi:hypothetical protein
VANTLTGLIQYIFDSVDVVGRELVGMIPSVYLNPKAEMAALNQDISYGIVPTMAARDIVPAATPPALVDGSVPAGTMKITKSRSVPFYWTGDDEARLGAEAKQGITNNKFAQAFRTLTNEIETDLAALQAYASRGYSAHATTPAIPFGTNLGELAQVRKVLADNGCPMTDVSCVMNTTSGAALRTLTNLTKVSEAGSDSILRQGVLLDLYGMALRESAQIVSTSAVGNNTGTYAMNGAHVAGATALTIKTGTGTILAGDLITIGADTVTKYVVVTGVNNGTAITIAAPGLMKAMAGNETIAVVGTCSRSMAFERSAIHLLTRLPKTPEGGDAAQDEIVVVDSLSGLAFRVAMYKGYHANQFEVGIAWGVKAAKTENISLLLGQ